MKKPSKNEPCEKSLDATADEQTEKKGTNAPQFQKTAFEEEKTNNEKN